MSSRGRRRKGMGEDGWEEWGGYMAAKIQKLKDQVKSDERSGTKSNIFKGISIFVNGYTKPSASDLKKLVIEHGGVFHHYYRRELVTHIIASNLPNSKIATLTDKKVCKPEWITDSIKAATLLPYQKYLLYPGQSRLQPGLKFGMTNHTETASSSKALDGNDDRTTIKMSSGIQESCIQPGLDHAEENQTAKHSDTDGKVTKPIGIGTTDNQESVQNCANPASVSSGLLTANEKQVSMSSAVAFRAPSKAGNSNFLSEFYTHSRLHHLSTWGAEFKAYVNQLQQLGDRSYPGRDKLRQVVDSRLGMQADNHAANTRSKLSLRKAQTVNSGKLERVIMHIDMDCFFVSVGLKKRPHLKGKPIAVTHSRGVGTSKDRPGTDIEYERSYYQNRALQHKKGSKASAMTLVFKDDSNLDDSDPESEDHTDCKAEQAFHSMAEIASCSYEARKAGVCNGMFMGEAKQLCPDIVTIPYDFEGYNEVSRILYNTVARYTHDIEAVSCDEMLIDCTDVLADTGATPMEFATVLRQEILESTECNASAGMGPNVLIARLATKVAKPNGQYHVSPQDVEEFIKDKPVKNIPGIGYTLNSRLSELGIMTCGDMQALTLDVLQKEFGPKTGQTLYNSCRGIDKRPLKMERERKSVSAEINYGIRFTEESEANQFIKGLAGEVSSRLEKAGVKGKTITLKVKVRKKGAPRETAKFLGHGVCDNVAKSTTIAIATDNPNVIAKEALSLLHALKIAPEDFRGLGLQISRLETPINSKHQDGTQSILQFTVIKPQPKTSAAASIHQVPATLNKNDEDDSKSNQQPQEGKSGTSHLRENMENISQSPPQSIQHVTKGVPHSETVATAITITPKNKNHHANSIDDLILPSPSQVDKVVLSELPDDIRLQIEAALERKKQSVTKEKASESDVDNLKPGCSFWQTEAGPSSETNQSQQGISRDPSSKQCIEALPTYSQVDQSCLAALPIELRQELEKAYAEQRSNKVTGPSEVHPLMRVKEHSSPGRSPRKSPRNSKKQSPFKAPHRRPPSKKNKNLNPKKLEFTKSSTQNKITKAKKDQPLEVTDSNYINLAGAVTLTEVKALMKDWVESSHTPEEEDLAQFVQYLGELVWNKNLEQVDLLIKYLYRLLVKEQSKSWWNGAVFILEQTQEIVKAAHGAVLKLPEYWVNVLQGIT